MNSTPRLTRKNVKQIKDTIKAILDVLNGANMPVEIKIINNNSSLSTKKITINSGNEFLTIDLSGTTPSITMSNNVKSALRSALDIT